MDKLKQAPAPVLYRYIKIRGQMDLTVKGRNNVGHFYNALARPHAGGIDVMGTHAPGEEKPTMFDEVITVPWSVIHWATRAAEPNT